MTMASSITLFEVPPLGEPDKNESGYSLKKVHKDAELYKQVVSDFKGAGLVVQSIENVLNHHTWLKYSHCRQEMQIRTPQDPAFKLNERYLYHGTKAKKTAIVQEGFDKLLATEGCFGKGIYFSDTPKKCMKYSIEMILLARVVLGEVKEYPDKKRDPLLVREPEKPIPMKGWRYFDSVKGRPVNHNEYVVYRNEKALIEYIITYSKAEEKKGAQPTSDPQLAESSKAQTEPDGGSKMEDSSDDDSDSDSFNNCKEDITTSDEDDDGDHTTSDEDDGGETIQATDPADVNVTIETWIEPFDIPEGELTLKQKKEEFIRITKEGECSEVDRLLKATDEDLERAIFLYYAEIQVNAEEAQRKAGEYVEEEMEEDDGSPIFPPMEPEYESDAWNKLGEEDKTEKKNQINQEFLKITLLEEIHLHLVTDLISNAKYNLDTAVQNYYQSFL